MTDFQSKRRFTAGSVVRHLASRRPAGILAAALIAGLALGCSSTYYAVGDGDEVVDSRGRAVDGDEGLDSGAVESQGESNAEATEEELADDAIEDAER